MSEFRIASRYAKALFEKALETKSLDAVKGDIDNLIHMAKESQEFVVFLQSPLYKKITKQEALNKLFAGANDLTKGVFMLMTDKFREAYIPAMGKVFLEMYNKYNHIVEAVVTTAVSLDASSLKEVESYVKENSGAKKVQLVQQINPAIIGGLTIEFGGRIYDNTISNQIRKIKKELQLA